MNDRLGPSADKTRARLKRDIAYYAGVAGRSSCRERIRLAQIAIARCERRLMEGDRTRSDRKEER
jgi:hypothetical protein